LNDALGLRVGVNPNIAEAMGGFYLETGYRAIARPRFGELGAFIRYEDFNTQRRMPPGYVALPEFDRNAWVVGATYWPDPDVAVKVDYTVVGSQSTVIQAPDSFNIGLGWWF
jgi:hypothetical protein